MTPNRLALMGMLAVGISIGISLKPEPQKGAGQVPVLMANQYVENSAEYRALCLQTYAWSESMLRHRVRTHGLLAERDHSLKPPAIVLDLDETVLDNTPYQVWLDRSGLDNFDVAAWLKWERSDEGLEFVPGAKHLLDTATDLGVRLIFISNRTKGSEAAATDALAKRGVKNFEVSFSTGSSNKESRRVAARANYDVLMYFGDNLRDFSEDFKATSGIAPTNYDGLRKAIEARNAVVDHQAGRFGTDYIIIPNPIYGEFQALMGEDPHKTLRPTTWHP